MKICIVATSGISLSNFRGQLIRDFVGLGHQVTAISVEPPEQISKEMKKLGADYYRVSGSRTGISLSEGFRMIKLYREAFKSIQPDICFLYMSKPMAFGGLAAIKEKTPHIYLLVNGLENAYYRSTMKDALVRFLLTFFYRRVGRHSDCVFVQNSDIFRFFSQKRIISPEKMIIVNGSGVDMAYFSRGPLPDQPVFLMTARLLWSKGIREFLEAARLTKKAVPEARFILVGGLDHNDESLTQEELDEFINEQIIEYCGFAEDVRPFIIQCSVYVLPSYHEGIPRSVLEAMSMGRAVITTTAHGCTDTVEDGVNGFKVAPRDVESLAVRMIALAKDKALREAMGEESYNLCCEKYEVSIVNRSIIEKMDLNKTETR